MLLWLATAWSAPPVVPDARFPFDLPDPRVDDVPDRVLTGAGCTEGAPSFHPDAGEALDCPGSGQAYDVTAGSPVVVDGGFSLAAWIRPEADCLSRLCVIAAQGNTGGDPVDPFGFLLFTEGGGLALEVQFDDGSDATLNGAALAADAWQWVVAVYEPGEVRLYLDGVRTHTLATRSDDDLGEGLRVGYVVHRSYDYAGDLDELLVFDRSLDDGEVEQLWDWYDDGDGDGRIMDADCDPTSAAPCDTGATGATAATGDTAGTAATGDTAGTAATGDTADTAGAAATGATADTSGGAPDPTGSSGDTASGDTAASGSSATAETAATGHTGTTPTTAETAGATADTGLLGGDEPLPTTDGDVVPGATDGALDGCTCTQTAGSPWSLALLLGAVLVRRRPTRPG